MFLIGSFSIFAQSDNCSGATNLPVNASCTYSAFSNTENGQPETGGIPNPSCISGTQSADVWYTVTGTGGSIQISVNNPDRDATVAVWSNCPATTQVACMNVASGGTNSVNFSSTLSATYYVQIIRTSGNSNADLTGQICAQTIVVPSNDNCSGATVVTQQPNGSCTTVSSTVANATSSGIANCTGTADDDVWFVFTATDVQAIINRTTTGGWDSGIEIFSSTGAAPGSCIGSSLGCQDSESSFTVSGLTVGMNYYVRVYSWSSGFTPGTPGFTFCVTSPAPLPPGSVLMTNGSTSACSGTFYDSGGTSDYNNSLTQVFTICPSTAGAKVRALFTSFQTEGSLDFLEIFDGNSVAAPTLGTYSGTSSPGTVQATPGNASGCLTFRFTSDGSVTYPGWEATLSCIVPCQTITSNLVSTNEAAGAGGIIRICQGESVNFVGSGTFSSSSAGATYTWSMGNGATVSGTNINYTWPAVGSYLVNLTVTDPSGCTNTNYINQQVQVSTTPTISTSATPATLCTNQTSNLSANVTMTPYTINCTPPVSGTTFLPDGSGVSYTTSITTNCYQPGLTVTAATDITNICLNMEHSYLGDLSLSISCPNGQSVSLVNYGSGGGSANLGTPWATATVDGSTSTTTPGTGANYCFTPSASTTLVGGILTGGTFPNGNGPSTYTDSYVPAGSYQPAASFAGLIGCPLNGSWTIHVTDNLAADNGYIFNWDINFSAALMTASSFTPTIVSQGWVPAATLTSTGATTAQVVPTSTGSPCFNYSVTDNFGCTYTQPQCITVNCTSLPVGLTSFEASAISNERVLLTWETSSETNSDYFNIERSIDGESGWELIATVDAAGNSAEALDYQTYDNDPYNGTSYYRLHQYDLNGMLAVTDLEAVYLDFGGESGLILFPNPSKSLVSVKGDLVALSTFEVLNAMGQNVRGQIKMFPQADGSLVMDISELSAGVYMVKNGSKVTSLIKE